MKTVLVILGATALVAACMALGTWVFQLLWNWIVPGVFGGPALTFWQALGLSILAGLLFKPFVSLRKAER